MLSVDGASNPLGSMLGVSSVFPWSQLQQMLTKAKETQPMLMADQGTRKVTQHVGDPALSGASKPRMHNTANGIETLSMAFQPCRSTQARRLYVGNLPNGNISEQMLVDFFEAAVTLAVRLAVRVLSARLCSTHSIISQHPTLF